jgi:nitrite reductase/ring-hydroxylating ferredoxin subunit
MDRKPRGRRRWRQRQERKMADSLDDFVAVADEVALREGELLGVEREGEQLVLARVDGQVYALCGTCSHQAEDLSYGSLEGDVLRCPFHNGGFNVKTGEAVAPPPKTALAAFDVRVDGGRIWVSRRPRG